MIDVTKPLSRGLLSEKVDLSTHCVDFKFERLLNFYFHCGGLGHEQAVFVFDKLNGYRANLRAFQPR